MRNLKNSGYIIESTDRLSGTVYRINYAKWNFRYITPDTKLYRCKRCGKIYSYSIKNLCSGMKCNGELEEIMAGGLQKPAYYGGLFSDDKLIPMLSREHTAQLSSETAGKYQKDFEEGLINVLSCSTTFEMGVDVGELEATFLRNVPPETSNYIQRAGRAGRRTSSAAFSVTFSKRSSHDMTFYHDPSKIIAGEIAPPALEISNEKIAERHLNSIVISWFFKNHPEFFSGRAKRIVSFDLQENIATMLKADLDEHPAKLMECIHEALPENNCRSLRTDEWRFVDRLCGEEGSLTKAIEERTTDIGGLRNFIFEATADLGTSTKKLGKSIAAAEDLITTLDDQDSISFLSAKGVLPKYGFPIDTVSLDILSGTVEDAKRIDLTRDLRMAISEFAPPASIVANNKVWQSYAINTIPDKSWPTYIYYECPACKKIYPPADSMVDVLYELKDAPIKNCGHCGTLMNPKKFIIPLFGFSTKMREEPKSVGDSKPSTYYSTRTQFWGIDKLTEAEKAEAKSETRTICGKKTDLTYSPGGKLFVLNRGTTGGGIRVCPVCGYAKKIGPTNKEKKHETKYGRICGNRHLVTTSLGHNFSTDILKMVLPEHEACIASNGEYDGKEQNLSVLYAILEGASIALNISRSDISGCLGEDDEIILYDDTPGGSGYVKQIFKNFELVLRTAQDQVDGRCGCTAETSCYGCLRNYSNQLFHDTLSRGLAHEYLSWLLDERTGSMPKKSDTIDTVVSVPVAAETIGTKTASLSSADLLSLQDNAVGLDDIQDFEVDECTKSLLVELVERSESEGFEPPVADLSISTDEGNVWPEMLWPMSKVAVFSEENKAQYKLLKKYNWYCYLLNESLDAELLFSHIKRGE